MCVSVMLAESARKLLVGSNHVGPTGAEGFDEDLEQRDDRDDRCDATRSYGFEDGPDRFPVCPVPVDEVDDDVRIKRDTRSSGQVVY
jgi:hypothetical protein